METHEDGDKACRHWVGLEAKRRENNGNGVAMEMGPGGTYRNSMRTESLGDGDVANGNHQE